MQVSPDSSRASQGQILKEQMMILKSCSEELYIEVAKWKKRRQPEKFKFEYNFCFFFFFFLLNYEEVYLGYSNSFHYALGAISRAGRNLPLKLFNLIWGLGDQHGLILNT